MSTTDVTIMSITTRTHAAAQNIAELLAMGHQQAPNVVAMAGVCSGFSYKTFGRHRGRALDLVAVSGAVKVIVEPTGGRPIAGATLDCEDRRHDAGHHRENPNSQRARGDSQSLGWGSRS